MLKTIEYVSTSFSTTFFTNTAHQRIMSNRNIQIGRVASRVYDGGFHKPFKKI